MKRLLGCSFISLAMVTGVASAQIALPKFANTFNAAATRGFYFQAPTDLILMGLQVPDERKRGTQMVAVYRLTAAPPAFNQTVQVTPVFFKAGVPSNQIIAVPVVIFKKNEWVAVLGACGPNTGSVSNSYGTPNFASSVLGIPITLSRCGFQANLAAVGGKYGLWSENAFPIARIRMFIAGNGKAETYGKGSGSATPPELLPSDPFPPSLGKQGELILKPAGGMLAIGLLRSSISTPIGTLLNFPFLLTFPVSGSSIQFPVPAASSVLGFRVTFQAGQGGPSGLMLTNGLEWTIGR